MSMYEHLFEILNSKVIITILVLFAVMLFKKTSIKLIKSKYKEKDKRHTINMLKNTTNISFLLFLCIFWSSEFQNIAISIAAFMVAIVIATKEMIQSFIGFLYISSTRVFRIGDWVSIGANTGEVIETDWAKTTLMEVDKENYNFTGKTLFIPNSQLLILAINNLNFMKRYVHHEFDVVREDISVNPFEVKDLLLTEINKHSENYSMVAERYNSMIETKLGVKISGAEPIIKITTTELGKIKFHISVFCPTEQVKDIEQKIMEDFFNIWFLKEKEKKEKKEEIEIEKEKKEEIDK